MTIEGMSIYDTVGADAVGGDAVGDVMVQRLLWEMSLQ
jgi:hypothetical protein